MAPAAPVAVETQHEDAIVGDHMTFGAQLWGILTDLTARRSARLLLEAPRNELVRQDYPDIQGGEWGGQGGTSDPQGVSKRGLSDDTQLIIPATQHQSGRSLGHIHHSALSSPRAHMTAACLSGKRSVRDKAREQVGKSKMDGSGSRNTVCIPQVVSPARLIGMIVQSPANA